MGANGLHAGGLATFRAAWVTGHLDRLRAFDALQLAKRALDAAAGNDAVRSAEAELEGALTRLAEVEAALIGQFNRFCGIRETPRAETEPTRG
jgi:hypothetical protein